MEKAKTCATCKGEAKDILPVPYVVHEEAMARAERAQKSLVWLIVLLIVLLVGTNGAWLWYESSMEVVEETIETYEIIQDGADTNNSVINGGDIVNGETAD